MTNSDNNPSKYLCEFWITNSFKINISCYCTYSNKLNNASKLKSYLLPIKSRIVSNKNQLIPKFSLVPARTWTNLTQESIPIITNSEWWEVTSKVDARVSPTRDETGLLKAWFISYTRLGKTPKCKFISYARLNKSPNVNCKINAKSSTLQPTVWNRLRPFL